MNIYEFMSSLEPVNLYTGIDALTITGTGLSGKLTIDFVIQGLSELLMLDEVKPFRFQGARGWSRGSVSYADKMNNRTSREWAIVMIRGAMARRAWEIAEKFDLSDNKVTRVDVCVDLKLRERVLGLCRKLKDGHKAENTPQLIEGITGDTLYYGSRQSDKFARIYDKSAEYGEEIGNVYRFELEAKGEVARGLAELMQSENGGMWKEDIVFGALKDMGCPVPKQGVFPSINRQMVNLSSAEMKLNWLRTQVRGTVKHLVSLGLEQEATEALGLESKLQGRFIDENGQVVYTC